MIISKEEMKKMIDILNVNGDVTKAFKGYVYDSNYRSINKEVHIGIEKVLGVFPVLCIRTNKRIEIPIEKTNEKLKGQLTYEYISNIESLETLIYWGILS